MSDNNDSNWPFSNFSSTNFQLLQYSLLRANLTLLLMPITLAIHVSECTHGREEG
ncbi:MAG: hypothetical protein RKH07_14820 [Gammaproteobacteria bacterium]